MEMNNTLFCQQLHQELRKAGFNPKGLLIMEYRNSFTFEEEKLYQTCKDKAEKRTLELQNKFPNTLGINHNRLNSSWIADAIRENKPLCRIVRG